MKITTKLTIILLLISAGAKAQVGVNTLTPDTSAILHVYSNNKGVLLPEVNNGSRKSITTGEAANGLLVFDPEDGVYYFFNKDTKEWMALNTFKTTDEKDDNGIKDAVRLSPKFESRNVVIGAGDADANVKLHVKGNIKTPDTLYTNTILASGNATVNYLDAAYEIRSISLRVTDSDPTNEEHGVIRPGIIVADAIEVEKGIRAKSFNGYGTIPLGGIIMWSGEDVPDGWALCDGQTVSSYTTPDLRGRFVVGYGKNANGLSDPSIWDDNYRTLERTGGFKDVTLTVSQMPEHSHKIGIDRSERLGGKAGFDTPSGSFSEAISSATSGGGESHENRPPYYVLAFIMRVK